MLDDPMEERPLTAEALREFVRFEPNGVSRLNRSIYTDPRIFDLEMKNIWERVWIFVAHESQLPKAGDYVTTAIGRQPVFAMRDKRNQIGVFMNACSHRGATLCRLKRGQARVLVCPYHGWTFDSDGTFLAPKEASSGAYPPGFDKRELGLKPVARVATYRGFVFACLDPDVPDLETYLGDAKTFIDLVADQGPALEILKGVCSYTYDGNWKLQVENGVDGYHPSTVHFNFIATQKNRTQSASNATGRGAGMNPVTNAQKVKGGYFDLGHGHSVIWGDWSNPEDRFNYARSAEYVEKVGTTRTDWIIGRLRNLLVYPSMFLMDQQSSQIRVIQPISVNKTKVTVYCIAPVGEAPAERTQRIRFYEDFFNASGMATPDDLSEFEASQIGFTAASLPVSDLSRGAMHQIDGPNDFARGLEIEPLSSGAWIGDEGVYLGQYRNWLRLITRHNGAARHDQG